MFRRSCLTVVILVILAASALAGGARGPGDPTQSSYVLKSSTIGSAGARITGTGKRADGTLGQPTPTGVGAAASKRVYAGFWPKHWIYASTGQDVVPDKPADRLFQNFPNPFSSRTTIAYTKAAEGAVEISIFNVEGRRVQTLVSEDRAPGRYVLVWDGRDQSGVPVAPGLYFCRFKTGDGLSSKKMLKLK
jgi:hypothetical protein